MKKGEFATTGIVELVEFQKTCSGFWLTDREFFLVLSILSRNTWKIASLPHLLSITCWLKALKANVYRPHSFVDTILEDGEIAEGEWHAETPTESLYSLEVPRCGHNVSLNAKAIRETFIGYFVNDGTVDWQWKYC